MLQRQLKATIPRAPGASVAAGPPAGGDPALRAALLCAIAAVGGALSTPGVDTMPRELTLIMLVGSLDDGCPDVRCAAAELLLGALFSFRVLGVSGF